MQKQLHRRMEVTEEQPRADPRLKRKERYLTVAKASRYIWKKYRRSVHPTSLHRWRTRGIGSVRLKMIRVGRTFLVEVTALHEFFEQLAIGSGPVVDTRHPSPRTEQVVKRLNALLYGTRASRSAPTSNDHQADKIGEEHVK